MNASPSPGQHVALGDGPFERGEDQGEPFRSASVARRRCRGAWRARAMAIGRPLRPCHCARAIAIERHARSSEAASSMTFHHPFATADGDKLREECGIFGVIGAPRRRRDHRAGPPRAAAPRPGSGRHHQLRRAGVLLAPRPRPCRARTSPSQRRDRRAAGHRWPRATCAIRPPAARACATSSRFRRSRLGRLRDRAQRQHLERDDAAARAGAQGRDLPVDLRHRGDHPPRRHQPLSDHCSTGSSTRCGWSRAPIR